jgi:hypothetical protein
MGKVLKTFESYQLGVVSTVTVLKMKGWIITPSAWLGAPCRVLCTSHLCRVLDSVHSNRLLYDTFFDSAA